MWFYSVAASTSVHMQPHPTTTAAALHVQLSLCFSQQQIFIYKTDADYFKRKPSRQLVVAEVGNWVELWLFIHLPMFLLPMCVMTTVLCTLQWCRCLVSEGCWCHPVWLFFSSVSKVNFNEPISMLQRLSEDLEYHELLDKAAKCHSSLEQMCYVAAFSVSSYSTTVHRTGKPFNPLLGETFELDRRRESGYRSLCEQVRAPTKAGCQCTGILKGK